MADEQHLKILWQGVEAWNHWRQGDPLGRPNLNGADLYKADLRGVNLRWASLRGVDFRAANLRGADLRGAILSQANLARTDLTRADLSAADLQVASLVGTILCDANLTGCQVYGAATWGSHLEGATQVDLIITPWDEPIITVDNLEVAQFIYLLLNSQKIRDVIDTITSKVVLILGRFTPERKALLDGLRETLRKRHYLPVAFDCDQTAGRDLHKSVSTLAHLARFVIADISDPASISGALREILPDLAVPVQPIIDSPQRPWGMFEDFPGKYHWVLPTYEYTDLRSLLAFLEPRVIAPAEAKAQELAAR
jgi:uncharacterized protein YjbI with pentapeptide repeats